MIEITLKTNQPMNSTFRFYSKQKAKELLRKAGASNYGMDNHNYIRPAMTK